MKKHKHHNPRYQTKRAGKVKKAIEFILKSQRRARNRRMKARKIFSRQSQPKSGNGVLSTFTAMSFAMGALGKK